MKQLKILYIEPFYGGSHKDFTDGLIKNSSHDFTLVSLPARYWKWRMRGAALYFSEQISNPADYDLVFTSDMMSLSDLKMLWGADCPPSIVYFHENQLSYPLPEGERMDYQFGFTDITTALAADTLWFNSYFHMNSFLDNMPGFIKKMPEYKPLWVVDKIRIKSKVLYPGCNLDSINSVDAETSDKSKVPIILWNHRWEFDKCPEVFFKVLQEVDTELKTTGIENPFNLAILGENFQAKPSAFLDAKKYYKQRILQYGFCESKDEYYRWLKRSDFVISTAIQENFGISIVEAIHAGAHPLLPDRLSYPELIPQKFHNDSIYATTKVLKSKLLSELLRFHENNGEKSASLLAENFRRFDWKTMVKQYDNEFINCYLT